MYFRLIKKVYEGTPPDQMPPATRNIPLRFRTSDKSAVQVHILHVYSYPLQHVYNYHIFLKVHILENIKSNSNRILVNAL